MNWAWPPSRCGGTDQLAGQLAGDLGAVIVPDDVQAEVELAALPADVRMSPSST